MSEKYLYKIRGFYCKIKNLIKNKNKIMNPFQTEIDNIFYQKALEKISASQTTLTPKDLSNLDIKSELQSLINEHSVYKK